MTILLIGFGYSGEEIAVALAAEGRTVTVTARHPAKVEALRAQGWAAVAFDGGAPTADFRTALAGAECLVVTAGPGEAGDPVLGAPGLSLAEAPRLKRVLYLSTVGVYGDHAGQWVDEETLPRPAEARSKLRLATEMAWQAEATQHGFELGIFRLSGIYGPGRSAIDAMRAGTARRIIKQGQVFNRIHVADIAQAMTVAARDAGPLGLFNLTDDEPTPPQDVVLHAAHLLGMTPPPEVPFEEANLSAMARSFYGETKRVSNARIKARFGLALRYPTYREGLLACL